MPSDDGVAVGLVAHYLCPVPVSCTCVLYNGSEEEGTGWETKSRRENGGCHLSQSVCKGVLAGEGDLRVGHTGKLISLCRGLQTSFSK